MPVRGAALTALLNGLGVVAAVAAGAVIANVAGGHLQGRLGLRLRLPLDCKERPGGNGQHDHRSNHATASWCLSWMWRSRQDNKTERIPKQSRSVLLSCPGTLS